MPVLLSISVYKNNPTAPTALTVEIPVKTAPLELAIADLTDDTVGISSVAVSHVEDEYVL